MAFVPRLSESSPTNLDTTSWYTSNGNWFYANGYYYPSPNGNCTWYAYGRYAEVNGAFANLPLGNAGTWFENATSFHRGVYGMGGMPQLGCIICFKSASGTYPGHLTVVEQINPDGSLIVSNSGYQFSTPQVNTHFWTATVRPQNQYREPWYTQNGRDYYCQGFIYNTSQPDPPLYYTEMPLWFYLRRW